MSVGRFKRKMDFPDTGRITVRGPFDPEDDDVDSAKVLFLIVQGQGKDTVVADGEGTWKRGENNGDWIGSVDRHGKRPGGDPGDLYPGVARGIALSVVNKPGELFDNGSKFDPPSIEALTWCADFLFDGSAVQA